MVLKRVPKMLFSKYPLLALLLITTVSVFLLSHTPFYMLPKASLWTLNSLETNILVLKSGLISIWFGIDVEYLLLGSNWFKSQFSSGYLMSGDDLTAGWVGWVCNMDKGDFTGWYCSLPTPSPPVLPFNPRLPPR